MRSPSRTDRLLREIVAHRDDFSRRENGAGSASILICAQGARWEEARMLTLSRKIGESLRIGQDIRVHVRAVRGQQVQISIEAPADVGVYREEVFQAIRRANLAAAAQTAETGQNEPRDGGEGGNVMKVETTRFGTIEVPENSVVEFPEGLVGLNAFRRFVLIDREGSALRWMQSLDYPELAFLVADPQTFITDYSAEIPAEEIATLGTADSDDLALGVICTVPTDPSEATVNLRAPIVVDVKSRRGKQVVLNDADYSIHHPWGTRAAAA
jgi:flagellar assembly factor FliW